MSLIDFLHLPDRMRELWPWVLALDAWDYCDSGPIVELLKNEQIPPEFLGAVEDIVSGERSQKKKAAAKIKIPAADRMKIAAYCSLYSGICNMLQKNAIEPDAPEEFRHGNAAIAFRSKNEKGEQLEPKDVKRALEEEVRRNIKETAERCNVHEETIENLMRDLKQKIEKWPLV